MNKRIRKKQLKKFGKYVSSSDIWDLDITIAKFILPRIELFRKVVDSYPDRDLNSFEEWCGILDKMIEAFRLITETTFKIKYDEIERDEKTIEEGLDLFRKYYHDMWL